MRHLLLFLVVLIQLLAAAAFITLIFWIDSIYVDPNPPSPTATRVPAIQTEGEYQNEINPEHVKLAPLMCRS